MSKNFNAFCKSPLTDAEAQLLKLCLDGKNDYHRTVKGTKTSLFLTLLRAEGQPYQDVDSSLMERYTLDSEALDRLFDLADHMIEVCVGRTKFNRHQSTSLLKSIEPDLIQFRARQTRLLKLVEEDQADLKEKQDKIVAAFQRACEGKDWDTLSWLYFDAMRPEPKAPKPVHIDENVIQLPQRPSTAKTDEKGGLCKLMQDFNHLPKLKIGDVLNQIGEPPILTQAGIFANQCKDRLKIFGTLIEFLSEMQESVSKQINTKGYLTAEPTQTSETRGTASPVKLTLVR